MEFLNYVLDKYRGEGLEEHFSSFRDQFESEVKILRQIPSDDCGKILKHANLMVNIMLIDVGLFTSEAPPDMVIGGDKIGNIVKRIFPLDERSKSVNYNVVLSDFLFNKDSFFDDLAVVTVSFKQDLKEIIWPNLPDNLNSQQEKTWWVVHEQKLLEFETQQPSNHKLNIRKAGILHVQGRGGKKTYSNDIILDFFRSYFTFNDLYGWADYKIIREILKADKFSVTVRHCQNWIDSYKAYVKQLPKIEL
jgi:hypothetical protein